MLSGAKHLTFVRGVSFLEAHAKHLFLGYNEILQLAALASE